jgi:GntR family transcriptional regulator, transcriptional repressor for pyruvate dehydrogenase complex
MAEDGGRFGYERVIAGILRMIKTQDLAEGSKLPTLPELQDQFDVSSTTVRKAVDDLKLRGVVQSRQGSGLFVRDPAKAAEVEADKDEELRNAVNGLREEMRTLRSEVAEVREQLARLQPAPPTAEARQLRQPSRPPRQ